MKVFASGQRVELATSLYGGTVASDDGKTVVVRWDDGQVGILTRDRTVAFNAYRLLPLVTAVGGRPGRIRRFQRR